MVKQGLWKGLASTIQYILPIICLAASGLSAWRRKLLQGLISDVAQSQASGVLDRMSWRGLELPLGESFPLQGYPAAESGGGGADGRVDMVPTRPVQSGGEKLLVQRKQWRALKDAGGEFWGCTGYPACRGTRSIG